MFRRSCLNLKNKTYYEMYLEQLKSVKEENKKPRLLLHACCGPCSSYVLECLASVFDVTVCFYNPNIYPEEEYTRRKEELKRFLVEVNIQNFVEISYNEKEYYEAVKGYEDLGERSIRCYQCYLFRMEKSIQFAKENDFDYFTTTLSISPYKNSTWINEIGEDLEKKYQIKYLYSDFKKQNGYKRSLELSREYNLYRQDYCGCVYSKIERENYENRKNCSRTS